MLCVSSGCFLTPPGRSRCASPAHLPSRAVKIISYSLLNYSAHIVQILCKMEVLVLNNSMVNAHLLMSCKKNLSFIKTNIYKDITLKLNSKHFVFCSLLQSPSSCKLGFLKGSMYFIT